jgi:hypothetical protein
MQRGKERTMAGKSTSDDLPRELAHRSSDGLDVSLLWRPRDNRVTVCVLDSRTGDSFELTAGDDRPLDVFYHPYAYAAHRGIEYSLPRAGDPEPALP